jgi:hypothetical protein
MAVRRPVQGSLAASGIILDNAEMALALGCRESMTKGGWVESTGVDVLNLAIQIGVLALIVAVVVARVRRSCRR